MKKEYILTFCISFLILATVVIISLMILVPQQSTIVDNSMEEYSAIKKSDYTFKQTNSISFDSLVREYTISDEQIASFKRKNQYIAGNSDPFTEKSNNSGNTSSGNVNDNTSTQDKITNSNDGIKNPESTGK